MDIETRDIGTFTVIDDITIGDIKTSADAMSLKLEIMESVIMIDDQIQRAKSDRFNGLKIDDDWFHRANMALRFRRLSLQKLQEAYGRLAKKERSVLHEDRNKALINALRAEVGEDKFLLFARRVEEKSLNNA